MMGKVFIKDVDSLSEMKSFIRLPYALYRKSKKWCPPLERDEFDTFNERKNGALRFCEYQCFLAVLDGMVVGRVAAIINYRADAKSGEKTVRFGWFDTIDNYKVASALLEAVQKWGQAKGCAVMRGPLGFTDMDREGLLVDGFDHPSPFTCLYNYPYYEDLILRFGLKKDRDWIQRKVEIREQMPPMYDIATVIEKRYGLHMARERSTREYGRKYGMEVFHTYNEAFADIYGATRLDDDQIRKYLKTYVQLLNKEYLAICLNAENRPVGFAFCVPSLSRAMRKAKGRFFPFGFIHLLRAMKKNDTLEALIIGVLPEYQGKGASLLLMKQLHESCIRNGIKTMIINPQLEDNGKAISLFDQYEPEFYIRRRAYVKNLEFKSKP